MIYAVQPTSGGPVKIGTTENLPARIVQLEAHCGQPLALLATLPGGAVEERAIHARFSHLRFGQTEQFQPTSDLMAFLGRPFLVGVNPEAVEAMPAARPKTSTGKGRKFGSMDFCLEVGQRPLATRTGA